MDRSESRYQDWLKRRDAAGLRRTLTHAGRSGPASIEVDERSFVNFSGNDYLALSMHPALSARAQQWAERYGAGSAASRLVTGNLEPFERIEAKVAALKGSETALVMASGFQANAAVLQALLDKAVLGAPPSVFADRLNHASMHFGCQAAGVRQYRYRHCDLDHLESLLKKHGSSGPAFILTESVFSMDGDVAPMDGILSLGQRYGATVICDDAHATGVLGEGGRGLSSGADVTIGTFSKAMGSFGAYVSCTRTVRDYLVNRCTGLIYSTALPPPVLGAIDAALDLVSSLDKERAHVAGLADRFRAAVQAFGFSTGDSSTQIVPLMVGAPDAAAALSGRLADAGFWVTAIRPPTVPKDTARLRFAFSAAHTAEMLDSLLQVLEPCAEGQQAAE